MNGSAEEYAQLMEEITELRRHAAQLQMLEAEIDRLRAFYLSILENIVDGVLVTNSEHVIHYVNHGLETISARPRERLLGVSLLDDSPGESSEAFRAFYAQAQRTLQPVHYSGLTALGRPDYPCYQTGWLIPRRRDNEFDGMVCTVADITENKLAEAQLDLYRERLEELLSEQTEERDLLFETMLSGFAVCESCVGEDGLLFDCRFIDANPAFETVTAIPREHVLHKRLYEVMPASAPAWIASLAVVVATGEAARFESEIAHTGRHVEVRAYQPRPGQLTMILNDITGRKRLEEQLRQSQKMEAIGTLAGGIAHDFNNLLTTISGYSELLLDMLPATTRPHAYTSQISRAAEQAALLTRQLLAFSRRQVLQPRTLNLNDAIKGLQTMLRPLIGEDVLIRTELDPTVGNVKVDPGQLEQVIMNLAINAREAMPHGGEITITTRDVELDATYAARFSEVRPGPYVMMSISDTGSGIDETTLARIFEPFFTTKTTGTGLGLSTVYGIVRQSEGHIAVQSTPGAGTIFRVYLPRVLQEAESYAVRITDNDALRGTETILVVEDHVRVREFIRTALRYWGYSVLEAADGDEAQRMVGDGETPLHFDLLLTDIVMPGGLSGYQLVEALRARCPDIKVLYMSGYSNDATAHHGELDPGIALLEKPFTSTSLARSVREVLASGRPAAQET